MGGAAAGAIGGGSGRREDDAGEMLGPRNISVLERVCSWFGLVLEVLVVSRFRLPPSLCSLSKPTKTLHFGNLPPPADSGMISKV